MKPHVEHGLIENGAGKGVEANTGGSGRDSGSFRASNGARPVPKKSRSSFLFFDNLVNLISREFLVNLCNTGSF